MLVRRIRPQFGKNLSHRHSNDSRWWRWWWCAGIAGDGGGVASATGAERLAPTVLAYRSSLCRDNITRFRGSKLKGELEDKYRKVGLSGNTAEMLGRDPRVINAHTYIEMLLPRKRIRFLMVLPPRMRKRTSGEYRLMKSNFNARRNRTRPTPTAL